MLQQVIRREENMLLTENITKTFGGIKAVD